MPGMGQMGMPGMDGGMGQMGSAAQALLSGGVDMEAQGAPTMDMSSWAGLPDMGGASSGGGGDEDEQQRAIQEAVVATQQAQYMQQVQFLQQVRASAKHTEIQEAVQTGLTSNQSRFVDDYRAFKLCRFFSSGTCMQGRRCVYAHCYEELHPASPDMPVEEDVDSSSLSEMKDTKKEQDTAVNMKLRKKRDLCRKFMDTGNCSRGSACPNAHGEAEIGKMAFVLYDKVKLQICKAWERGKCSWGDRCMHAHGDDEIGQKRREFIEGPAMKRRADGQSMEDWRREILRDPDAPAW